MRTNYHTHTKRCLHAQGTEADFVDSAIAAGVSVLGFSDHAPFPDTDYGYRMSYGELTDYFGTIERLAKERAGEITIKKSLEIEYLPKYMDYYRELVDVHKVDYLLLGEHFFLAPDGNVVNITIQKDGTGRCLEYARAIVEALDTGLFSVVAHPDLYAMAHFAWDENCDAAADMIIEAAVKRGAILEFNANGFRRGMFQYPDGERYMYPVLEFWRRVAGSGAKVIVGSDCHGTRQVWDWAMPRSLELLSALGIPVVETID